MLKKSIWLAITGLLCLSSAVMAEDLFNLDKPSDDQFYGGFSLSTSDTDRCSYHGVDCKGNGWKLFGGYKFTPNVGVEGGYYRLFRRDGTSGNDYVTLNATGMALSAVGSMPLNSQTEVFGKAGFMTWDLNGKLTNGVDSGQVNSGGTDVLLGVGAGYKLTENWGIRGEYEHVGGDLKAGIYSVGTTFSTY